MGSYNLPHKAAVSKLMEHEAIKGTDRVSKLMKQLLRNDRVFTVKEEQLDQLSTVLAALKLCK